LNKDFIERLNQPKYLLPIIIILAASVRIIFFMGHVFSDDSYYSQLAISFLEGNYPSDFIGYPIHLARKLITVLTAVGFIILGENEIGSILFPFLFSILSLPIIYGIAKELFNEKIALTAVFLLAFFPTDIIFATLNFADLIAAFFINFGIYYLIKYYKESVLKYSFFAGMYFAISIFAKMSFYYVGILLLLLFVYQFIRTKKLDPGLLVSMALPLTILIVEGIFTGIKTGNYFYRLQLVEENYNYTYYNFFPYTILGSNFTNSEYLLGILRQVFIENLPSIFLRRFYLFVPILALIQSFILLRNREHREIVYWFLGLSVLFAAFTTSPLSYKPLDLKFSWYIYPLFVPAIILASVFINKFNIRLRSIYLILFVAASVFMSLEYQKYFGISEKNEFKNFISDNPTEIIFTDHHTKYGIDLIDGYPNIRRAKRISNLDWDERNILPKSYVIYNSSVVDELEKQGHEFKLFQDLFSEKFKLIEVISGFEIYQKVE